MDQNQEREQILTRLRAETADRPAHARYLELLIAHYESGGDKHEPPDPEGAGVSWEIQCDLDADVSRAFNPPPEGWFGSNARAYHEARAKHAHAAAKRAWAVKMRKEAEESDKLADLFNLNLE